MASSLIIQTHNPEDFAIKYAANGDLNNFYFTEIDHRKQFSYPPYSRFVKLSFRHRNPMIAKNQAYSLRNYLDRILVPKKYGMEFIGPNPAFISKERGLYIWDILLKINNYDGDIEQIKTRNNLLRAVPSGWAIDIDPIKII
jgi:primosomal protein N' (replication factor Y)